MVSDSDEDATDVEDLVGPAIQIVSDAGVYEYIYDDNGNRVDRIQRVKDSEFSGRDDIISLKLDVMGVGVDAFANCVQLESVTFSKNINWIGFGAFAGCTGLRNVTFEEDNLEPDNLEFGGANEFEVENEPSPGRGCFSNCQNLSTFKFPRKTETIHPGTFAGCVALKTVSVWSNTAALNSPNPGWSRIFAGSPVNTINYIIFLVGNFTERESGRLREKLVSVNPQLRRTGYFTEPDPDPGGRGHIVIRSLEKIKVWSRRRGRLTEVTSGPDRDPVVFRRPLNEMYTNLMAGQMTRGTGLPVELTRMIYGNRRDGLGISPDGALHDWTHTGPARTGSSPPAVRI
jgi:hypothetical protein